MLCCSSRSKGRTVTTAEPHFASATQSVRPNVVKQAIASYRTDPALAKSRPIRPIDWRWANMRGIDASGGYLENAKLSNANLSHAWLGRANLVGSTMHRTDLSGANLVAANLGTASLYEANLEGADLRSAVLGMTSFVQANLVGAHFANADLTEAVFINADISGANFVGNGELPPASGLTQQQLNLACADEDNPPRVDGLNDAITNKPLKWRGRVCSQGE